MNIAIFDIESAGALHHWSSIVEIGGVLVNKDLKELDRFNLRCRIPEGEIPQASALLVNRSNVNLLTKSNLSLYQMQTQLESIIRKWTPAIFMGWSNLTFDDPMIQNSFFRGLRYPYLTNSSPNKRHDGLKIAQGAYTVDRGIFKTENTKKGNPSLSLPSLCRNNGIESSGAGVEIIASLPNEEPVAAKSGNVLVTSFHPELTSDYRFHSYFLKFPGINREN